MEPQYSPDQAPAPKPKQAQFSFISNLAAALRMFQPILVNESGERWEGKPGQVANDFKWNGKFDAADGVDPTTLPTIDQLINTASAAMQHINGFIQYHEKLKQGLAKTQRAFAEIEDIVLGNKNEETLRPLETIAEVTRLKGWERKAIDVLTKAASSKPEQAVLTVQAFMWPNGTKPTPLLDMITGPQDPSEN